MFVANSHSSEHFIIIVKKYQDMIEINDYLEKNLTAIQIIISEFGADKEFSSHDFIEKFTEKFESDYIDMLIKYQKSGQSFQTVHSLIARYLSSKTSVLKIEKTNRKESENVHGKLGTIQWWLRTN